MPNRRHGRDAHATPLTNLLVSAVVTLFFIVSALTRAEEPPRADRPLLDQLNHETEALYREVAASLVRVQMPQPRWMSAYAMAPINRWEKLDPEVRRRLENQLGSGADGGQSRIVMRSNLDIAATQPSEQTYGPPVKVEGQGTIVFVVPQAQNAPQPPATAQSPNAVFGAKLQIEGNAGPAFAPNNAGILLDEAGHVLVPLYLEREAVADAAVRVNVDGKVVDAKFIGSDRQTNLTLIQIDKPTGKPVTLSLHKPMDGSLVLCVSPIDGSGRLALWNGGQQDYGIVFTTDGGVAGIARYGQFLSASACHLIAEQLIQYGAVRRATLGVIITEIRPDDALREKLTGLGTAAAIRIDEVVAGSAADRAGLKPGDILLSLAGEAVSDIPSFAAAIAAKNDDEELQILRGNDVLRITVALRQQK